MKKAFQNYKLKQPVKSCTYHWQQLALDTIAYLDNPVKSQVFKYAKEKESTLKAAISYMKERKIKNFRYLAAIISRN